MWFSLHKTEQKHQFICKLWISSVGIELSHLEGQCHLPEKCRKKSISEPEASEVSQTNQTKYPQVSTNVVEEMSLTQLIKRHAKLQVCLSHWSEVIGKQTRLTNCWLFSACRMNVVKLMYLPGNCLFPSVRFFMVPWEQNPSSD